MAAGEVPRAEGVAHVGVERRARVLRCTQVAKAGDSYTVLKLIKVRRTPGQRKEFVAEFRTDACAGGMRVLATVAGWLAGWLQ